MEPMDVVTDDMTEAEVRNSLSKVDMLALRSPPERTVFPVEHAAYLFRMEDDDSDTKHHCEFCSRAAIVTTEIVFDSGLHSHVPACELCAGRINERLIKSGQMDFNEVNEYVRTNYETKVGTPLNHVSDELATKIRERFAFDDV
jgi:hypothetical protein